MDKCNQMIGCKKSKAIIKEYECVFALRGLLIGLDIWESSVNSAWDNYLQRMKYRMVNK